jgi:hypothetical protein
MQQPPYSTSFTQLLTLGVLSPSPANRYSQPAYSTEEVEERQERERRKC